MIATCGQFQRSSATSVFRVASNTPAYWSTGNAVWASSANGRADESLTQLVTWPNVNTGYTQSYSQVWVFGSNMYVILSDQSRVYEFAVPGSARTISSGNGETAISESPNAFVSAVHVTRTGNSNGAIYLATANVGVGVWTKSGSTWSNLARYTIPTCNSAPCFRFQYGAIAASPAHIYLGASLGRVVRVSRSDSTNNLGSTIVFTAAAGSVNSIAYAVSGGTEYLYIASSVGLVFQYSITAGRINSLALISNPSAFGSLNAITVAVEPANGGIFVSATDGSKSFVSRLRADDTIVEQIDTELIPEANASFYTPAARAVYIDPGRNIVVVGTEQPLGVASTTVWNQTPKLHRFSMAACGSYDCSSCGSRDPNYCGFCPSDLATQHFIHLTFLCFCRSQH